MNLSDGLILGSQFMVNNSLVDIKSIPVKENLKLEPIPITTKKLSDLGFRRIGKTNDWVYKNVFLHRRIRGWVTRKSEPELKYIHELQLYVYCKTKTLIKL